MKRLWCAVVMTVTLALPCFSVDGSVPVPGREIKLNVQAARNFFIILPANPTTGYDWQLLEGHDETILSFIGRKVETPVSARRVTGAPVREKWSFNAKKSGTTTLRLAYKRSWEPEIISTMTYIVTVK